MRKWLIMVAALLMVVACHHKDKKAQTDSVPPPVADTVVTDTVPEATSDTVVSPTKTTQVILQKDSAEVTHLRILARKVQTIYPSALLVGEWIRGTEHEEYYANGTGKMWDTSEDVTRDEAQRFEWTLDSNLLTIVCRLELGAVVPKRYVVTFADDENLAYNDHHGTAYLWDKKK